MALPTTYTEPELKTYLNSQLGAIADLFGFTVTGDSYDEVVNDALGAYDDANDITLITGVPSIKKLRALARLALWEMVSRAAIIEIDYAADGGRWSRSQVADHVATQLQLARVDAMPFSDDYTVGNLPVQHSGDPYEKIVIESS